MKTHSENSAPAGTRIERDTMGELAVPANAYYGVQTARAIENFPISSMRMPRAIIRAMGLIKRAAAAVNVLLTTGLCLGACALGLLLTRALVAPR